MYWIGDSAWPWQRFYWRIPKEILQGVSDNIPFCCTLWYTFAVITTMIISHMFRKIMREKSIGRGWTSDLIVFSVLFEGKLDKKKRIFHSVDFSCSTQYWRCPVCRLSGKIKELRWDTGLRWEK